MPINFTRLSCRLARLCAAFALGASACLAVAEPATRDLEDRTDPALQRGLNSVVRDVGLTGGPIAYSNGGS